jgi:CRP/FNR family transcriptional regulator, cyclic AMP receptor protein
MAAAPNKILKIPKGEYLFREGDNSENMYLIKSGRVAITKKTLNSDDEIILAEKINGELIGEMAFFDNKPRSAGAQALANCEIIELPFASLQEQFNLFPMWIKVLMKTTVGQLRDANTRIKNLENITSDTKDKVGPHVLLRVCAIIDLIRHKAEETEDGIEFPYKELHFYCNQVFHQTNAKIVRCVKVLQKLEILNVEENEGGDQKVTLLEPDLLSSFTTWYNKFLSSGQSEQVHIDEREVPTLQVLAHYGEDLPVKDGLVTAPLKDMADNSFDDVDIEFKPDDVDSLVKKGVLKEKTFENEKLVTKFDPNEISRLAAFWKIIHTYYKHSTL